MTQKNTTYLRLFFYTLYTYENMETFLKIFFGFWAIWILWYVTGGPLRDDRTKPYIAPNGKGSLETFGTSSRQ